jgi:hypothetical protein
MFGEVIHEFIGGSEHPFKPSLLGIGVPDIVERDRVTALRQLVHLSAEIWAHWHRRAIMPWVGERLQHLA